MDTILAAQVLLADGGSSEGGLFALALPFVVGPAVFGAIYGGIYRYYRNKDKRFGFERETDIQVGNLQAFDHRVGDKNRQRSATMSGANQDDPLTRVGRMDVK
ncbi:hypothetical protein Bra3105_14205 [Brachybacterium halotolerans subsp. kimchii]|uniref:hypothetical protein n=1 Tax=Brachybacterium halotolerans TaxID=2795215 RepID=UPI001E5258AD|nr:hypothetical protein [Brachybacterium halotolerans]UEJ81990.1 hypothetical protein Bra3105_14205 [Brachybacterium halotolerans subsp. kimchii]